MSCGLGGGSGPRSGAWWLWLGGTSVVETGSVDQTLQIPTATSATLKFYLEIPIANNTGLMNVKIDGTTVFSVTQADAPSYPTYTEVTVDIGAFADGGMHTLRFESTTQPGSDVTNFFVDDITIELCGDGGADQPDKVGTFRKGSWFLDLNGNGQWDQCLADGGQDICFLNGGFGSPNDLPVAGDWDGTDVDKVGIFRKGSWYLDLNGNGRWDNCLDDGGQDLCIEVDNGGGFGTTNDRPVAGDWNGTGVDRVGVFRKGSWFLDRNGNGMWDGCGTDDCYIFGAPSDGPVSGRWMP
ncbi:MAG: hypothetical protein HC808_19335 [Candidatus Competibacteraceae bacterium]|nr:hypothetical protein [Candidatus Competibacteraceae bacterium]